MDNRENSVSLLTTDVIRRTLAGLVLLLACHPLGAQVDPYRVLVVQSSDNVYFNQTIDTLRKHAGESISLETVVADEVVADELEDPVSAALFIALGPVAAERVASLALDTPVINAYLTLEQYHQLGGHRYPTILLDQPLARYLAFSKFALQVDSIGIMTREPIALDRDELTLLERLPLKARQYEVDADNKLLPTLRHLLEQDDALLMLPRQSLYNHDSLKGVLMTSYRSHKPVISYSPAHVKSGALASIYSSPIDIGRHLSILMNQTLQQQYGGEPRFHFARFYTIALNSSVASALGLTLPSEARLRQQLDALAR